MKLASTSISTSQLKYSPILVCLPHLCNALAGVEVSANLFCAFRGRPSSRRMIRIWNPFCLLDLIADMRYDRSRDFITSPVIKMHYLPFNATMEDHLKAMAEEMAEAMLRAHDDPDVSKPKHTCTICGDKAVLVCGTCKSTYYCTAPCQQTDVS